jgi:hypothetical protein
LNIHSGGTMARTIVAIYDDFQAANSAVRELVDSGFPRDNISIIANSGRGEYTQGTAASGAATTGAATTGENVADETGAGAGVGAGIGAAIGGIGGLLVGLGALTIPGIGPVIAAGPLAVALSTLTGAGVGAVAGGVTGGLLGALIGLGIPEEEAEYYAEGVRRGGVLLTVQADDFNTDQVIAVLNRHDPVDINERASQWRDEGWEGFNPEAGPIEDQQRQLEDEQGMRQAITYDAGVEVEREAFHNHYNAYLSNTGYPYDYYLPAYRYGHGLASSARYKNNTWDVVEPDVRRDWEREHPGTWDRFRDAVRHAWEDATGQPHDVV